MWDVRVPRGVSVRSSSLVEQMSIGMSWVRAEGHEALARAHALSDDLGTARRHADEARAICDLSEDIEDRNVVPGDLATLALD